jgi:hypothetical protein
MIILELSINQTLLNLFSQLSNQKSYSGKKPVWVKQIDEILHESFTEKLEFNRTFKNFEYSSDAFES